MDDQRTTTKCRACGNESRADRRYCGQCGGRLTVSCPACLADSEPNQRYCGTCGAFLTSWSESYASDSPARLPEGERRQLTIMFCDLVGSTDLCRRMDAEDWRATIERYQRLASRVVTGLGGYVARFLGDGLLIYFGWPQAYEDAAARAVRAALELAEAIPGVSAGGQPLAVRIAVHTGAVVIGTDGEIFGDAPNVAARVQSAAEPGTVVATDATRRLVARHFQTEDLGLYEVKGVSEPLALHRVVCARSQPSAPARRTDEPGLAPFIGRAAEQAALHAAWARVGRGSGQVVVVTGEPGIGKSRLVHHFAAALDGAAHTWLESGGSPYHQHTPFHPVGDLLRQGLGWRSDQSPEQRLQALERSLVSCHVRREAVALVAPLLDLAVPEGLYPPVTLSPEAQRRELLATLVAWVVAEARRRTLVIVLEDLHWVDPSTLELQGLLAEHAATAPLLLLYTSRNEFQIPWPAEAHHVRLALNRIDRDQARELVTHVAPLADDVIETIVARTDGVPLFVEELAKAVLERTPANAAAEIPSSLQDSLMARLDRLGPERQVAQLAAVIGREFSRTLLEPLAQVSVDDLEVALRHLIEAGIVRERNDPFGGFVFKHALMQEAAYESLLRSRRRQIHGQVARCLANLPAGADAQPEVIARHYAGAGEVELAVDYYRRAGEQAMRHCAHTEAIQHYSTGIELVPDVADDRRRAEAELTLRMALGAPLVACRGYGNGDVEKSHRRAYELCGQIASDLARARSQALSGIFLYHQARAELQPAAASAAELLELGERDHDDYLVQWGCFFSSVPCYYRGEYRAALAFLERGLAVYDPSQAVDARYVVDHDSGLSLLSYAAMAGWSLGATDRALAWIERAVALGRASRHPFKLAFAQSYASLTHYLRGDAERVLESADEAARICTEQEFPVYLGLALMLQGWATAQRGDAEGGLDTLRRGLGLAATTGTRIEAPRGLALMAEVQLLCRRPAEALDAVEMALSIADRKGCHYWDAELLRLRGAALLAADAGADVDALQCFARARAVAASQEARVLELRSALAEADCRRRRGEPGAAAALVAPLCAGFGEAIDLPDLRLARDLLKAAS